VKVKGRKQGGLMQLLLSIGSVKKSGTNANVEKCPDMY
jgi:hypothetical protein